MSSSNNAPSVSDLKKRRNTIGAQQLDLPGNIITIDREI